MARPTKLTPEIHQKIIDAVLGGNATETAAEAFGVSERAFYEWLERGRRGDEGDDIYVQFAQDVMKARAQAELGAVEALRVGMLSDPRFAVEWLKRARHQRWEPSQQVEVRVGELDKLSDEEVAKRFSEAAQRVAKVALEGVILKLPAKDEP